MTHFTPEDSRHMARALELARRGLYTTDPNPRVGCVLVRDGQVVGEGWHQRAGGPHAERHALMDAGEKAKGATCYVTLEPCSHTGRTGPCADALLDAGVARVVAAMTDPNPAVSGQGLQKLAAAGLRVQTGLMETQARALNPGFISRMERGRPWVRVKLAASVDGRTAMASGESQWITGAAAREDVQRLRARSSAVVTGIGTVLRDAPALTVRAGDWALARYEDNGALPVRQPLRVVLDRSLRLTPDATLLKSDGPLLVVTCQGADSERAQRLTAAGAEIEYLVADATGLSLPALLESLARRECNELLVEAGHTLAGAFVAAGLVDELIVYMAPCLMGSAAMPLVNLPLATMAEKARWRFADVRAVGEDIRLTLQPERE